MAKPKLLIVGTFHFHQDGVAYLDIQSPQRQAELEGLAKKFAEFQPDALAVERMPEQEAAVNRRYQQYLADGIIDVEDLRKSDTVYQNEGDVDEIVMLGFRIAQQRGLTQLKAVNCPGEWLHDEAMAYARAHQPDLAEGVELRGQQLLQAMLPHIQKPLPDIYRFLHQPETALMQHSETFLYLNAIGAFDSYEGANFVSAWYARNLRIFANLQALARQYERILLLIGFGHLQTLNTFAKDSFDLEWVDPLCVLGE